MVEFVASVASKCNAQNLQEARKDSTNKSYFCMPGGKKWLPAFCRLSYPPLSTLWSTYC